MKKLFLLLFCLFLAKITFAQTPQTELKRTVFEPPKTVNGFKVRWATLSKGKYQEVFTNDTIQQIGCIYFNRITGEVVGEVIKDSLYFPADVSSRWWSVDPLAAKFPEQSPYVFADNNPINLIDPDGQAAIKPTPQQVGFHLMNTSLSIYYAVKNGHGFSVEALTNVVNGGGNWNRAVGAFAEGMFADRLQLSVNGGSGLMGGLKGLFTASINTNVALSPKGRYGTTDVVQTVGVKGDAKFTYPILTDINGKETSKTVGKGRYTFLYEVKASDSDFTITHLTNGIGQLIKTMDENKGKTTETLIPILVVDSEGFKRVKKELAENPNSTEAKAFSDALEKLKQYGGGINVEENLKQGAKDKLIEFKTEVNREYK